ncbi:MAG: YkvA family protein [Elusimicrobiota bacterium]
MLRAFKSQLKLMAMDPTDAFADHLRRRVGAQEAIRHEQPLRNMILVMPEMLMQIRAWMEEPGMSTELRRLQGFVLTYLYHPRDILPEEHNGLFGYLDDAFLVSLAFRRTLIERRGLGYDSSLERELVEQLPDWLRHVREVIPQEAGQIEGMLDELLMGKTRLYEDVMARARQ